MKYKKGLNMSSPAPNAAPTFREPVAHHIKRKPIKVLTIL